MSTIIPAYAVYVNSDLTEGRGTDYPLYVCRFESTAIRLAKGKDVQGTNGSVKPVDVEFKNGRYYGPIRLIEPTYTDKTQEKLLEEKRLAVEKAKKLGLTDEELLALKR